MPVAAHPVHPKTAFKEVPLSPCHSSLPDQRQPGYAKLETVFIDGIPEQIVMWIRSWHDFKCKQPDNSLPECRNCEWPERIRNAKS